eukprot:symbB.v1.2.017179.t1/scaffold1291.1/size126360/2
MDEELKLRLQREREEKIRQLEAEKKRLRDMNRTIWLQIPFAEPTPEPPKGVTDRMAENQQRREEFRQRRQKRLAEIQAMEADRVAGRRGGNSPGRSRSPGSPKSPLKSSPHSKKMLEDSSWPCELLEDPQKAPRFVNNPQHFAEAVLLEDHLEDVVILPDGLRRVGLAAEDALPSWLSDAMSQSSVLKCMRHLGPQELAEHKAALEYPDDRGVQREALPRPYPFCLWQGEGLAHSSMPEAWRDLQQRVKAAEEVLQQGEVQESQLYACEMRRLREREANVVAAAYGCNERTKSLCLRHGRDWLGKLSKWSLYWNCYDDGIFIGGRGSGKGLHVDQVLWSNLGKHWQGHKILITWPAGKESAELVRDMGDAHFRGPLQPQQLAALKRASRVALLRPGDLFLCSGGVAHATISVSEKLTVTGYESFVGLQPRVLGHMLETGSPCGAGALNKGVMESDELKDVQQTMLRRLNNLLEEQLSRPQSAQLQSDGCGEMVSLPPARLRQQLAQAAKQVAYEPTFAALASGAGAWLGWLACHDFWPPAIA